MYPRSTKKQAPVAVVEVEPCQRPVSVVNDVDAGQIRIINTLNVDAKIVYVEGSYRDYILILV